LQVSDSWLLYSAERGSWDWNGYRVRFRDQAIDAVAREIGSPERAIHAVDEELRTWEAARALRVGRLREQAMRTVSEDLRRGERILALLEETV
jgi:hypothetical protein